MQLSARRHGVWHIQALWSCSLAGSLLCTSGTRFISPVRRRWLGFVILAVSLWGTISAAQDSEVLAWGSDFGAIGVTNVPKGLTNVVAIAAGEFHALALTTSGHVVGWGANGQGQATPPESLTNAVAVAAGWVHSLALTAEGRVVAWGSGEYGITNVPVWLSNVVAIAAGEQHSLALTADGTVVEWGRANDFKRMAHTNLLSLANVMAIAAARYNSLALLANGTVVGWGDNIGGQTNVPSTLSDVVAISDRLEHCLALKADGTVVGWGYNGSGQATVPAGLTNVVAVAAGGGQSLALKSDGTMVAWGTPDYGLTHVPAGTTNLVAISAGDNFNLALKGGGAPFFSAPLVNRAVARHTTVHLYAQATGEWPLSYQWCFNGTNLPGATNPILSLPNVTPAQTGRYSVIARNRFGAATNFGVMLDVVPTLIVQAPQDQSTWQGGAAQFSVAVQSVVPVTYQWLADGAVLKDAINATLTLTNVQPDQPRNYAVVVSNDFGIVTSKAAQLSVGCIAAWGNNDGHQTDVPPGTTNIIALAAGALHSLALRDDGRVVAWGDNEYGQVTVPEGLTNAVAIAAGYYHNVALTSEGRVLAWGAGWESIVPTHIGGLVAVAAGPWHALALREDGTLVGWGQYNVGDDMGPVYVPSELSNVVAMAGLESISLALKDDGTVFRWGFSRPLAFTGWTNIVTIAGSFAVDAEGTVRRLGHAPQLLSNAVAVAAGYAHALALSPDGTVQCWGEDTDGETDVPAGLKNVVAVAAGRNHSLALIDSTGRTSWRLPALRTTPSEVRIEVATQRGRLYTLESNSTLTPGGWTVAQRFAGNGIVQSFSVPLTGPCFYRARRIP